MGSSRKNVRVTGVSYLHFKLIRFPLLVLLLFISPSIFAQSDDDVSDYLDSFLSQVEKGGVTIDDDYLKEQTDMPADMKAALRDSLEGKEKFVLTKDNAAQFISDFSDTLEKYGFQDTGNGIKLKNNRFLNLEIKGPGIRSLFGDNDEFDVKSDTSSADFPVHDINSDLYNEKPASNLDLDDPVNNTEEVVYDPISGKYVFSNKIGDEELNAPVEMDEEEYKNYALEKSVNQYFKTRSFEEEETDSDGSLLDLNLDFSSSSSLFGNGAVNIKPQGSAELTFSVKTTETDNPTISEANRKNTYFDLDNKIRMNVVGTVGDKINLDFNYNTEATFNFDNEFKLEYEGEEDDIIKNFKAGNVSMPSVGTMITVGSSSSSGGSASLLLPGYQELWGFQNTQQWGDLTWSWVISQQESETETMTISGGAVTQEFDIGADEYDANRHFFLSHFFKDNYDKWMAYMPNTDVSGLNITKIEVWVTNKTGESDDARNVIGFMDLGEPDDDNIHNTSLWNTTGQDAPCNDANNLYTQMTSTYADVRDIYEINNVLGPLESSNGFVNSEDYEKVEYARKLSTSEYSVNATLGYISLNSALNSDEVLAVSYQYTYNGSVYQVGEFSTGSGITAPDALFLKLIKGTSQSPTLPTWDLMMKNIYALDAYNMSEDDFEFKIVYENDKIGAQLPYITEGKISKEILLQVLGLDNLNSSNEEGEDGFFDWVEGYTVLPDNGRIIFPVREPFGSYLKKQIGNETVAEKYIFQELYDTTLVAAQQMAEKNKFYLQGEYSSSTSSEIKLSAFNIPRGSVIVTAGGTQLTENIDYTVDYNSGYIRILNEGVLESGKTIQITMEDQAVFSLQKKTLLGSNWVYRFSDNFQLGASVTHLSESTTTTKVAYGSDPISNTVWGFTGGWYTELPFLTKMVNKLPFTDTKANSSLTVKGEIANLIADHSNDVGTEGVVYVDDFESSKVGISIQSYYAWNLASTPKQFSESTLSNSLEYGYNRSKLSWYSIDRLLQIDNSETPDDIDDDDQSYHYSRSIDEDDLFPNADQDYGESSYVPVLNLAYYPEEKGPYNYDTDLDERGRLNNPENRWAGITREITTTNFESSNIEYIEFWMMDPFIYEKEDMGGDIYINLGNISEDILKDGRKSYENGLPTSGTVSDVDTTVWGRVSTKQALTFAFSNSESARPYQDLGLDGLNDEEEEEYFGAYIEFLKEYRETVSEEYRDYIDSLIDDPSQDNFHYFRGSDLDDADATILNRYKNYSNPQGNSTLNSDETYSTAATSTPNAEDINEDYTMSESDNYFEYHFQVNPEDTTVGDNFIADTRIEEVTLENGEKASVKWYQYRIPIGEYESTVGSISDFTSIRFMRMYMTGFEKPIVMRLANFQLVRSDWRTYDNEIEPDVYNEAEGDIDLEAVNYEENSERSPVNYVLPPDVSRALDPSQPSLTQLNEQSLVLRVRNLSGRDSRACYKTAKMDFRQYETLEMYVHAEALPTSSVDYTVLEDEDLAVFIRLGTDYNDNYYEYELPLYVTPPGTSYDNDNESDRYVVWPEDNNLEVPLELFTELKTLRNTNGVSTSDVFSQVVEDKDNQKISIVGNPTLSNVKVVMIGVRNSQSKTTELRSAEIWVNELRLTGFAEDGGWAGNATATMKIADIGTVTASGAFSTAGWGSIEESLMDRQMYDARSYDISTSLELGRLVPRKLKLQMPMYYSYSQSTLTPKYDPLNEDLLLDDVLDNAESQEERDSILDATRTFESQRSLNFSNIRFNISGKTKRFYDPANLSASYSFTEIRAHDETVSSEIERERSFGLSYKFSPSAKAIEPFKKISFLQSDYLALIRDFNFYLKPQSISLSSSLDRSYYEIQARDLSGYDLEIPLVVSKDLYMENTFSLSYKFTNSLTMNFSANSEALIDEVDVLDEDGDLVSLDKKLNSTEYEYWWDAMMDSLQNFGKIMDYSQSFKLHYTVPTSKIPILSFVSLDGTYSSSYAWERGTDPYYEYLDDDETDSVWVDNGNEITNSQRGVINAGIKMSSLYNKSKYLSEINKRYGKIGASSKSKKYTKETYEEKNIDVKKGKTLTIKHKLGSTKATVKVFDADGKVVRGRKETKDDNTVLFVPSQDIEGGRAEVSARVLVKESFAKQALGYSLNTLMGVRSLTGTFTRTGSTTVPGFTPDAEYFMDNSKPGWDFALGWQNRNIFTGERDNDYIKKFYENGWLVTDTSFSSAYYITEADQIVLKSVIEPLPGLKINLSSKYSHTNRFCAYFEDIDGDFDLTSNVTNSGSYSHSFMALGTLFEKKDKENYTSAAFDNFMDNRDVIASRRRRETLTTNEQAAYDDVEYDLNSSEILIPAFLAAYGGESVDGIGLDPTPTWRSMLPNWSVTYSGLAKAKFLKDKLKSLTLNHAYTCTYNIGSYSTDIDYTENSTFVSDDITYFSSEYEISSVTITEGMNPLIGVDLTLKNSVSLGFTMNKIRSLALNISSNQLVETRDDGYVFSAGYTFKDLQIFVQTSNDKKKRSINNDLKISADFSISDVVSVIRTIEESDVQPSSGNKVTSLELNANYVMNKNLNITVFYDKQITAPVVSTSYKTSSSEFGITFTFSLTQ